MFERESIYPLYALCPTVSPFSSLSIRSSPDEVTKKDLSVEERKSSQGREEEEEGEGEEGAGRRRSLMTSRRKEKEEGDEERKEKRAMKDTKQIQLDEREEKKEEPHFSTRREKEKEKGERKKKTTHADQDDFVERYRWEMETVKERRCIASSAFLSKESIDEDQEIDIEEEKRKRKKKTGRNGEILLDKNDEDEGRRLAEEEEIFALELELIASELDLPVLEQLQEKSILSRFLKDHGRNEEERKEEKKGKIEEEGRKKEKGADVDERTSSKETSSLSSPLDHHEDHSPVEGGVRCMYTSAEGVSVYDQEGERKEEKALVPFTGQQREGERSRQTIHSKKEDKKTEDAEREEVEEEERRISPTNKTMPALLTSTPSSFLKEREKTMKGHGPFSSLLAGCSEEMRQREQEEKRKKSIKISEESQRRQKEKEEKETKEEVEIGAVEIEEDRRHDGRVAEKKEKTEEEERKETKEALVVVEGERDAVDITQRENEGKKKGDVPLERQRMVMRCMYTPACERGDINVEEIKRNEEEKEEGERSPKSKVDCCALAEDIKTPSSFSAKKEANRQPEKDTKTQKEEEEERGEREDGEKEETAQWREFLSWLFLDKNRKTSRHSKEGCEKKEMNEGEGEERKRREEENQDMKSFSTLASHHSPSSSSLLLFLSSMRDDSRHEEDVSIRSSLSLDLMKDKRTSQLLSVQSPSFFCPPLAPSDLLDIDVSLFSERQKESKMKESDDNRGRREKREDDRLSLHMEQEEVEEDVAKRRERRKKDEIRRPQLHLESPGGKAEEESYESLSSDERRYLQNEMKIEMLSKLIEHVEALLPSSPHTSPPLSQGFQMKKRRIERTLRKKRVESTPDKASCGSMSGMSTMRDKKKKIQLRMKTNKKTFSSLKDVLSDESLLGKIERRLSSQERAKQRRERRPPISPFSSAISSTSVGNARETSFASSSSSKPYKSSSFSPSSLSDLVEKKMREERNLSSHRENGESNRNAKDRRLLLSREKESTRVDKEEGEKQERKSKTGEEKEDERKKEKSYRETETGCVQKREEEGSIKEEDFSREITAHGCLVETREKDEEKEEEGEKKEETQVWTGRRREGEVERRGEEDEEEERREVGGEGEEEEVKLVVVKNRIEANPGQFEETWRREERDMKCSQSSQMKEEEKEKEILSEGDGHAISKKVGEKEEAEERAKEREEEVDELSRWCLYVDRREKEKMKQTKMNTIDQQEEEEEKRNGFEEERYLEHMEGNSEEDVHKPRSSVYSKLSPVSCSLSLSPSYRRATSIQRPSALSSPSLSPSVESLHSTRSFSPSSSCVGENKEEENRNDIEGEEQRLSEIATLSSRVLFLPSSSSSPLSGSTSSDLSSPSSSVTSTQWRKEEKIISSPTSPLSSHTSSSSSSFFPSSLRPSSTCSFSSSSSSIPSTPSRDRSHTPVHADSSSSFLHCISSSLASSSPPPSSLPPSSLPSLSTAPGPFSSSSFPPLSSSSPSPSLPSSPLRSPPSRLTSSHLPPSPSPSSSSVLPSSTAGVSCSLSSSSPLHHTEAPSPSRAGKLIAKSNSPSASTPCLHLSPPRVESSLFLSHTSSVDKLSPWPQEEERETLIRREKEE